MPDLKKIIKSFHIRMRFFRSIPSSSKVLDIGCGIGLNAISLREHDSSIEVYGNDIMSPEEVPDFIKYQKVDLDAGKLPYPDNCFDVVLFTHVIEHLRNPHLLGSEINRVLKKGGSVFIEAPNWTSMLVPSWGFQREQHSPFNFFDDPTHFKPWSKHGFFEYLSNTCSLEVKKVGTVRSWVRIPLDLFIIIYGLVTKNRSFVVSSVWNIYGWAIYGIGTKR